MSALTSRMPDAKTFEKQLRARRSRGRIGQGFFLSAILVGLLMLVILLISVFNQTFGIIAVREKVDAATLVTDGRALDALSALELAGILETHLSKGQLQALMLQQILPADVDRKKLGTDAIGTLVPGSIQIADEIAQKKFAELTADDVTLLLADNLSQEKMLENVNVQVVGREIVESWPLLTSLFNRGAITQEVADKAQGVGFSPTFTDKQIEEGKAVYGSVKLQWTSWLDPQFITTSVSSTPADTGIRQAVVGSLWILLIAIVPASLIGVGAALYLEEYAKDTALGRSRWMGYVNQFVETNIRNLAGVPSIIYGLLGLAVFANLLEPLTSGQVFGVDGANGRTVLTAGLTLAVLILPVIIINAQEAIRAVPSSIREASYGLGATKWQTVSRQVIPAAVPGIMTGIILSLSRAIGESAPLVVVGAAVFLSQDPNGPFKAFTTLPIQIYNWAAQPSDQFRNASSAAIIVLLVLLLLLNATAIFVRQRFSRKLA